MTNFCGSRFVPNYATLTDQLCVLTQKNGQWKWSKEHDEVLTKLKQALSGATTPAYFDLKKKTELYVDASPVGLCAVL